MAFYVLLLKQSEDDSSVVYRFGPNEERMGTLRLDKRTGEFEELEPAPDDPKGHLFVRGGYKVRQHWEKGSFPDRTCWAS